MKVPSSVCEGSEYQEMLLGFHLKEYPGSHVRFKMVLSGGGPSKGFHFAKMLERYNPAALALGDSILWIEREKDGWVTRHMWSRLEFERHQREIEKIGERKT